MVHKRSALAKEARQVSSTASREARAVPTAELGEGESYALYPGPSAVIFALEPLRRSLLSLPITFLRAAARRLREILAEINTLIRKHDEQ